MKTPGLDDFVHLSLTTIKTEIEIDTGPVRDESTTLSMCSKSYGQLIQRHELLRLTWLSDEDCMFCFFSPAFLHLVLLINQMKSKDPGQQFQFTHLKGCFLGDKVMYVHNWEVDQIPVDHKVKCQFSGQSRCALEHGS